MITRLLGTACGALTILAGAPWWMGLAVALLFQLPGRLAPLAGPLATAAVLPWTVGTLGTDVAAALAGALAGMAAVWRVGKRVPWVAVPWFVGGLVLCELLWRLLPPRLFWDHSDVGPRARLAVAAGLAIVGLTVSYLPRYRNEPALPGSAATVGTAGALEDNL